MSAEVAQKVGRGGAGNFYTKTDIETTLHKTLPRKSSGSSTPTGSQPLTHHITGRGGIGNYIAPSEEISTSSSDARSDVRSAREALDATKGQLKHKITSDKGKTYRGISGRGGIGNWKQGNDEAEKMMEEEEMKVRTILDERVRLDVEKGLTPPPRAHVAPKNKNSHRRIV